MKVVNMHQAKTTLSRLVKELRDGTEPEIVIAIDGTPAARLVPYGRRPLRALGIDAGLIDIADDFDAADEAIAVLFETS